MEQQTPGVYINEINAFPNSVVEVATAVPVFIGYTSQASYKGESLTNKARRVTSLKEFESYYGQGALTTFTLLEAPRLGAGATTLALGEGKEGGNSKAVAKPKKEGGDEEDGTTTDVVKPLIGTMTLQLSDKNVYALAPTSHSYYLYNNMRLFYQNGGSTCYVISLGGYEAPTPGAVNPPALGDKQKFLDAIDSLIYEQEPTMIVAPDALLLSEGDYYDVMKYALAHCAETQSRVTLVDVYYGAATDPRDVPQIITDFRTNIGQSNLKYGAAYFPWVHTNVLSGSDTTFMNFDPGFVDGIKALVANAAKNGGSSADPAVEEVKVPTDEPALTTNGNSAAFTEIQSAYARVQELDEELSSDATLTDYAKIQQVHNTLMVMSKDYVLVTSAIGRYLNTLPASSAMAGVYASVDKGRGVWKAPANVSLNAVQSPTVSLSDKDQANLNVDAVTGKSVNAIRPFPGLGVLVWGARTLDGNSQDWRYVNVRRTMIMIEQSIKLACRAYVFEPNDANTWVTVKSMINSFLFNLWKQGALAGASPDDAYSVAVGLGSTMTADDILNGYMNVFVKVAISRPAEFIVLNFQQQMQKS
ncbi:phage tail sheath family protein [Hymenobacter sp. BT175]|uniref:phage tail sheath family protein n=1 Tax=Hymenobacter translucens TaxID=2886507 RepID=UPI001D0E4C4F|nr:phage tail sheath C-terminal domain-containing protein [Hymenobacter translucens]MCC2545355.1 phage tail sheath family protein [Hymenobacter translucens]